MVTGYLSTFEASSLCLILRVWFNFYFVNGCFMRLDILSLTCSALISSLNYFYREVDKLDCKNASDSYSLLLCLLIVTD